MVFKIEFTHANEKGKDVKTSTPCSFGINATELFCELKGIELKDLSTVIGANMSMPDLRDLVFSGIEAASLEKGEECEVNKFWVGQGLDGLDGNGLMDLVVKFSQSLPKWAVEIDDKKKVTKATKGGKKKLQRGKA